MYRTVAIDSGPEPLGHLRFVLAIDGIADRAGHARGAAMAGVFARALLTPGLVDVILAHPECSTAYLASLLPAHTSLLFAHTFSLAPRQSRALAVGF